MNRTWTWCLIALLSLASAAWSQDKKAGGTEGAVAALEQQWLQSQQTNNPDLVAPLLAGDEDLAARVERLLSPAPRAETHTPWMGCLIAGVALALAAGLVTLPALLYPVHRFLEHLI